MTRSASKKRRSSRDPHPHVIWIGFFLVMAACAIAYLVAAERGDAIGKEVQRLERERTALRKRLANEERNWTFARNVQNMERLLARHGMTMGWPAERDVIRLSRRTAEDLSADLYADGSSVLPDPAGIPLR
jgi:hypothetical protein